ncbi:MAG: T9SS type A sorting domain-containing protein [Chitinophagaceae bacterium]
MKKPTTYLMGMTLLIVMAGTMFLFSLHQKRDYRKYEVLSSVKEEAYKESDYESEDEEKELNGADKQLTMWFQSKAYPEPANLSAKYMRGWQQALQIREENSSVQTRVEAATWTSLGQSFNGGTRIGGRVVCLAIDPNNSARLFAGSASGGIWKSTNGGSNWSPVTTNLPVLGVSSILIDPSNSNTIYAGTGEVYRVDTSNIGFNVWKTRGTYGIGIIKSMDGGNTWSQILVKNTSQMFAIQAMAFQPGNSSIIYACATDGLYRSQDGGGSWTKIYSATYVKDIAINPSNADQVVISVGNMVNTNKGIYRSTNGTNATPSFSHITTGLPSSFEGSIKLDNVGSGSLFASIGMSSSTASSNREVYHSTDFGATWSVVGGTTSSTTTNHCSYQFWFAHTVAINPFATDSIIFGGVGLYRYRVSNTTRTTVSGVHADHHDIVFDPNNRGVIYACNDGGIYKSTNGGSTFAAINTGLNATQFYASLGVSKNIADPNRMAGGLQDNGQVLYNGTQWNQLSWAGGDGTACAIDPNNSQRILVSRDARQVYRSTNGGSTGGSVTSYWGFVADSRTAFVAPLAFGTSNSDSVYLASDNLHISINGGGSFTNDAYGSATNYIEAIHKTAIALAVSPTNARKVYVSTSPFAQYDNDDNRIYVTGQPNILKTTTGNTPFTSIKGSLPDRFVMDIVVSPTNDDSVFIALGGFGTTHIYATGNGGASWSAIGSGLPDVPFNALALDPVNPKVLYAGCDLGVYVSPDRGQTWVDYNNGFWDATLVMDLQISADNKLIAATHGKGVFKSDLYSGGTLPAKLVDFNGVNRDNYNQLKWVVTDEQQLSRYELERSSDGIRYQRVTTKQAVNSTSQVTYTHMDPVSLSSAEYYYRLKIIDLDESYTYSSVVFIRTQSKTNIRVLNNPFRDLITLQYSTGRDQPISVALYTATGALVRRQDYNATAGSGAYTLYGFANLPKGLYFLKVGSGEFQQTFKLMKE